MHIRDKQNQIKFKDYILIEQISKNKIRQTSKITSNPFSQEQFKRANDFFSQFPNIDLQAEKTRCPKCNLLHKVYCLKCGELLVNKELIPKIDLPVNLQQFLFLNISIIKISVFILHHNKEKHQKSSAIPAKFLSDQVEVKDFPGEFEFDEHTYVLYPHQNAKYIKELTQEELQNIKKFVAIDYYYSIHGIKQGQFQRQSLRNILSKSLQNQKIIKHIFGDTHINELIFHNNKYKYDLLILVRIFEDIFKIFLYQHHSLKCLATIEAIYYCYQEYSKAMNQNNNYDKLLYFYKYTFQQITESLKKEIANSNIYEKIEQKKQRILQTKQDAKKDKQFKRLL